MREYLALCLALTLCIPLSAQEKKGSKIGFAYEASLDTKFDNREYDYVPDNLDVSQTLFGARLTAGLGAKLNDGNSAHKLMAGGSVLFNFGGDIKALPHIYYNLDTKLGDNCKFDIVAGIFPWQKQKADYSIAFYSDYTRYWCHGFSGMQFSWQGRGYYAELGVDWMGMIRASSPDTRERFVIYSGGHYNVIPGLKIGYAAQIQHYACSEKVQNVVDDVLVNPYIEGNFGYWAKMQTLRLRLGYLQALERDRAASMNMQTPAKGELLAEARKWNVGLVNDFFFGADLLPLYAEKDPAGQQYGSTLYLRDPFLRNFPENAFGWYDRLSVYYEPNIARWMTLRLQVNVHFNQKFCGWQQMITVAFHI